MTSIFSWLSSTVSSKPHPLVNPILSENEDDDDWIVLNSTPRLSLSLPLQQSLQHPKDLPLTSTELISQEEDSKSDTKSYTTIEPIVLSPTLESERESLKTVPRLRSLAQLKDAVTDR